MNAELEQCQREESALQERLQSIERQTQEAEKVLSEQTDIPKASILHFKSMLETSQGIIERQKKALAVKGIVDAQNEKQQVEIQILCEMEEYQTRSSTSIMQLSPDRQNLFAHLEETEKFFRWNTEASMIRNEYQRKQRQEAQRKTVEQKRLLEEIKQKERQQQAEKERQVKGLDQQRV